MGKKMREIGYRAYLKNEKQIVDVLDISFLQETIGYMNKADTKYTCAKFNDIELLPYTGLEDKNGIKIFEGDIVIAHYFFQNYNPITLGVFEDEDEITGKIIFDLDGSRVVDRKDECRQLSLSMIQEPVEELEVIGNIYDNPELLGE